MERSGMSVRVDTIVMPFGDWVKKTRKAKGMTLEQMADLAGTSKSQIWEIEAGNDPRLSTICAIAKAFKIKPHTALMRAGK